MIANVRHSCLVSRHEPVLRAQNLFNKEEVSQNEDDSATLLASIVEISQPLEKDLPSFSG